jgi:hypothetical protein
MSLYRKPKKPKTSSAHYANETARRFTFANWVFFLGPWFNPQLERQALSRIHRMGQQKTCHVIWLTRCGMRTTPHVSDVSVGTIHEIIRGNASSKMRRAEELMLSVDRQYPKVSEIYAQLTLLVTGQFAPRDGYVDYQRREQHRQHYLEQPSESLFLVPYASYRLAGIIPPRSSLWRLDALEAVCLDWTRLCAMAITRVLQDPHPATMAPPPQVHWLVDQSKMVLERERQLSGDYNELSLISCQVLPIGKAASAQLQQSVHRSLPLHMPTMLAFLSCQSCRMLTEARNQRYCQIHTVVDGSCAMPVDVRAVQLGGQQQAEVVLRNHSTQSYLDYTRDLVLPALLSGSSALFTRAVMTFFWGQPDTRCVWAAWYRPAEGGPEVLLALASGVYLVQDKQRVALFALGSASNEHVPAALVRPAHDRLCQSLISHELALLEPDELQEQMQMPLVQTRRGISKRPVLHLRAVDQSMVQLLSQQPGLVLKHQTHECHQQLCQQSDPCSQMAQDSGRFFTCTLIWETFDVSEQIHVSSPTKRTAPTSQAELATDDDL